MQPERHTRVVQPITILLATGLTVVAIVHGLLYLYWLQRVAYTTTLSQTGIKSAEQIFNSQDPYYTMRKFLRQHVRAGKDARTLVLVGESVRPPSRFDLEVYYELYPQLPRKVAVGSPELARSVESARSGTAFISEPALSLDPERFTTLVGEQYFIYVRK